MILLDECSSPYNVLISLPYFPDWLYFSDFMNRLPPPPEPVVLADGIHMSYFRLRIPQMCRIKPLKEKIIIDNIDDVISEIKSWAKHPIKYEYCVRLARLLMCLNRRNDAIELFQMFEESKVSDRQYASWMVDEIESLRVDLGTERRE